MKWRRREGKKEDVKHLKKYTETSYQLPIESNSYYCWGYCFRQFINVLVKWNSATAHDIYCECKFGGLCSNMIHILLSGVSKYI